MSSCRCPDSPTRPSTSPGRTTSETSTRAWTSCPSCLNVFDPCSTSSSGFPFACVRSRQPRRARLGQLVGLGRGSGSGSRVRGRAGRGRAPARGRSPWRGRSAARRRSLAASAPRRGRKPGIVSSAVSSFRTPPRGMRAEEADRVGVARVPEDLLGGALPRRGGPRRGRRRARTSSRSTARLWLMKRTLVPNSWRSAAMRSSTSASTVASSPVVGSSRMRSVGFFARAIAMTTRCCMPPESWCG